MSTYITIDGGTSNTRIYLVENQSILDTVRLSMGARKGMENANALKDAVKAGILEILSRNNMQEEQITRILASGMITSEFGLCNVPHITVPAGIEELHSNMKEICLSNISPIPFVFIPGVKTRCETLETADIMRGEETELMGLAQTGRCAYVLPGSHSKIIYTDNRNRIIDFSTMLTGEMIASISQHTILSDAVRLDIATIDSDFLLKGFRYCQKRGINEALFKVRILKNIFQRTSEEIYSFFLGVVLCQEIELLEKSPVDTIILGGREQIRNAMATILKQTSNKEIICLNNKEVELSTSLGMVRIYEQKGKEK